MATARDIANNLIHRAKNLDQWIVTRKLPNGFKFTGTAPYDMWIYDTTAEITVWAVTSEEAEEKVDKWIKEHTE